MKNLSRRQILHQVAAAGIAGKLTSASHHAVAKNKNTGPHILCIVSEDNNPFIGAYGDKLAKTPHIDALANRGLLYRNVYSTAPVCAPSRFGILTGVLPESCGPAQHMRAIAKLPPLIKGYPEYLREIGYYCTNSDKTDYNCDIDPAKVWNDSGKLAHWRNRKNDQPFLSVFNLMETHESRLFRSTPGTVKPESVRVPAYLPDTPEIRNDIASYYNLMEKMDTAVGMRLAELAADALDEDTIVIYYSDNGGALPRSKRYCYEEGLRCAMVVYIPPKYRHLSVHGPGSEVSSLVSFIDLAPTLLSIAGINPPAQMQGRAFLGADAKPAKNYAFAMRNRMDERYDMVRTVTDGRYRYIRNYMPNRPWGQHASFAWLSKGYQSWERAYLNGSVTPQQAQFFKPKPFEELYDLQNDVDQLINLAEEKRLRPDLTRLRSVLDAHLLSVNDNGFIPEGSPIEGFLESQVKDSYPLEKIMALASLAARRPSRRASFFSQQLSNPNEVMRYWAAQALLMLEEHARPQLSHLTAALQTEKSPQVKIVIAEALLSLGATTDARATLIEYLDGQYPMPVQLMALNALTFSGVSMRDNSASITRMADHENLYLRSAARYLVSKNNGTYQPEYPVFELQRLIQLMRDNPKKFAQ